MTTDNLLTLLASIPQDRLDELRARLPGKTQLEYSTLILLGDAVSVIMQGTGCGVTYWWNSAKSEETESEQIEAETKPSDLSALKPKSSSSSSTTAARVERALELIDEIQDLWPENDFAASVASYIEQNDFVTRRQLEGLESVLQQAEAHRDNWGSEAGY